MNVTVSADENTNYLNCEIGTQDSEVISEIEKFLDNDSVDSLPVISYYSHVPWEYCDYIEESGKLITIPNALEKYNEYFEKRKRYLVFSDTVTYISVNKKDANPDMGVSVINSYADMQLLAMEWRYNLAGEFINYTPTYIRDLKENRPIIPDAEKQPTVNKIICFVDSVSVGDKTWVYFETDKGNYIKYYSTYDAEAIVFTEDAFREYGADYYNNVLIPNANRGGSGNYDLISYCNDNNISLSLTNLNEKSTSPIIKTLLWVIPSAVIILGLGVFFFIKKRKKEKVV